MASILAHSTRLRILLVDDDGFVFHKLREALSGLPDKLSIEDCQYETATSVEEIEKGDDLQIPHLVIIDDRFRGRRRGSELLEIVRHRWRHIAVLGLSEFADEIYDSQRKCSIPVISKDQFWSNPASLLAAAEREVTQSFALLQHPAEDTSESFKESQSPPLVAAPASLETLDAQTTETTLSKSAQLLAETAELGVEELWRRVRSDGNSDQERRLALVCLIERNDPNLGPFLCEELSGSHSEEWKAFLVTACERVHFVEEEDRDAIEGHLFQFAATISPDSHLSSAVAARAAIRKYQSLINEDEASNLAQFLQPSYSQMLSDGTTFDVRQVTLQGVQHIFETGPPTSNSGLRALSDEVYEIARTNLLPHAMCDHRNAVLAINAIHALAVLGDDRLDQCIPEFADEQLAWLKLEITERLASAAKTWETSQNVRDTDAFRLLSNCIKRLES